LGERGVRRVDLEAKVADLEKRVAELEKEAQPRKFVSENSSGKKYDPNEPNMTYSEWLAKQGTGKDVAGSDQPAVKVSSIWNEIKD